MFVEHHQDKLYKKLFESTMDSFDILTQQCLEVLFHAILIIHKHQCIDQLPGGKYWNTICSAGDVKCPLLPCFTSPWLLMKSKDLFISLKEILKFNEIVPDYSQRPSSSLKSKEEREKF